MERRRNVRARGQGSSAVPELASRPEQSLPEPPILIVDDDYEARNLYAMYLRDVGLQVVTARDGRSALNKVRALKPAVIVLDLMMPQLDGWDVLRELQGDESISHIPVIILTGHDLRYYLKSAALAAGAAVYLQKPCSLDELARQVRSLLDRRHSAA